MSCATRSRGCEVDLVSFFILFLVLTTNVDDAYDDANVYFSGPGTGNSYR